MLDAIDHVLAFTITTGGSAGNEPREWHPNWGGMRMPVIEVELLGLPAL
jgi:hypothetical protein